MTTNTLPIEEIYRLTTLRSLDLLDTPPEERFDRLTRIARHAFDVPIALVSLVDEERQWFKSKCGLAASQTPRDIAFCGRTIQQDELFVVGDASKDPRFSTNPLVTGEPNIRFYSGCPVVAGEGIRLGTLCIIDTRPRDFSREELGVLRDIAAMVEREISITQMAITDELTGLLNRRGFIVQAEQSLRLCQRNEIDGCFVYIDLNKFKQVNDTYGHAEGDRCLTVFADAIRTAFRSSDLHARLGGDEFVLLLHGVKRDQADFLVRKFTSEVEKAGKSAGLEYIIEFSCGIVDYKSNETQSVEEMLRRADTMMYDSKKSSTGRDLHRRRISG